ncbi:hemerythrin domain-containing protein [Nonomuraea ferruginea]
MATDVITLITNDHRKVEALFERLKKEEGDPKAAVTELHALLIAHARAEEDRVYPDLDAHHGLEEHKEAEVLLGELVRSRPGTPRVPPDAGQARRVRQPPRRGGRGRTAPAAGRAGRREAAAGARQGLRGAPGRGAAGPDGAAAPPRPNCTSRPRRRTFPAAPRWTRKNCRKPYARPPSPPGGGQAGRTTS